MKALFMKTENEEVLSVEKVTIVRQKIIVMPILFKIRFGKYLPNMRWDIEDANGSPSSFEKQLPSGVSVTKQQQQSILTKNHTF